jgi:glycine dehydrogenase subunit 1
MLERIGAASLEELFETVPAQLRARAELKLAPALAERALLEHMAARAAQNLTARSGTSFLGAGAYDHFIPSTVDALASRGEFATAYTPYQAEISQGTLQAIFEFQTLICQLLGLDLANASLYDGASATAEAALMALRVSKRSRLIVSRGLHPRYLQVLRTHTEGIGAEIDLAPLGADGTTATPTLPADTAALIVQYPNFLGCIEDLRTLAQAAHDAGALLVTTTAEPFALALLRSPGELGADIAAGEAQGFGVPLSFGGPYVGVLASRQKFVRQLPGRLIGETVDTRGERAFVMTLTTREQHIRREKATSNICTNQGLCALRVAIFLSLLGRSGLRRVAEINLSLAEYAKARLAEAGLALPYSAPTFNEFVVRVPGLRERYSALLEQDLIAGLPLETLDSGRADELLVCTTENTTRSDIDRLARELRA